MSTSAFNVNLSQNLARKFAAVFSAAFAMMATLNSEPSQSATSGFTPVAPIATAAKKKPTNDSKELSPDAIFKRYKDAVVRIEITLQGASLGVGSGFFYSAKGEIATSLHVIRPYLVHPGTEISVKLANGKVFRSVKIGACGDKRGVDLCLLKVDHTAQSILKLESGEVSPGESIVAIGHPRGLDFSISTGIVSALRSHPSGWREVQVDTAISPGNSGGPIINRLGEVIGIVYQFERDGQNLNFGILTDEADDLRRTAAPFLTVAQARNAFADRTKQLARTSSEKWIKPSIQSFIDPKLRPSGMKWMRAQLGSLSFSMLLPDFVQNCERSDDGEAAATACSSAGGDLVVTVQKRKRSLDGSLTSYRGQRLVEARPLGIVDRMESEGAWDETKLNRSAFMSKPSPARCYAIQKKNVVSSDEVSTLVGRKKGFFQDATSLCRFETENDSEPGAISTSQWIEVGNDFYGINVWATDPGRLPFLQNLVDLVFISAGAMTDEVKTPYRAHLRPSLRRNHSTPPTKIAGVELSDSYSDEISTVTIARAPAVNPSAMNRQFLKWANSISKSQTLRTVIGEEISSTEVAGAPARTGMWTIRHPADARKTALLMMTVSFRPQDSWIIYEVQTLPSSNQVGRAPSNAMSSDIQQFRLWTKEFQPLP